MIVFWTLILAVLAGNAALCHARTLVLSGTAEAGLKIRVVSRIHLAPDVRSLTCQIAVPPRVTSPTAQQRISGFRWDAQPAPAKTEYIRDADGRPITRLSFDHPTGTVVVDRRFEARISRRLGVSVGMPAYPLSDLPRAARDYLAATPLVQVGETPIVHVARLLTQDQILADQAVSMVLDWLVDNVRLDPDGVETDASTVLRTRSGNSEGLAHLAAALLRQAGLPTRVVVGLTVDRPWTVRGLGGEGRVFTAVSGRHTWIEVYYPGLGWLECDPVQTRNFVPPFFIRFGAGLDAAEATADGVLAWTGGQDPPDVWEEVSFEVVDESDALTVDREYQRPWNIVLAALTKEDVRAAKSSEAPPGSERFQPAPLTVEQAMTFDRRGPVRLGASGPPETTSPARPLVLDGPNRGRPALRGRSLAALGREWTCHQAFVVDMPLELTAVLAPVRVDGGSPGSVRAEIRPDRDGRPGPVVIGGLSAEVRGDAGGPDPIWLRWPVAAASPPLLLPGRYWVSLDAEPSLGAAWPFSPGNLFGQADDTLLIGGGDPESKAVLNGDFQVQLEGFRRQPRLMGAQDDGPFDGQASPGR